jgi:hypothetical protein
MSRCSKSGVPSPKQIMTALLLVPQATILFTTLAHVSVWRGLWLTTLLFAAYLLCTALAAQSRLHNFLFRYIPDQQTLYHVLYLCFASGLPLSIIGTLFYKHPVIRQIALFTWALFIFMPSTLACQGEYGLNFDSVVGYLIVHHLALFGALHFGFTMGIPFKLTLALSLFAAFLKLSKARPVSSPKLNPSSPRHSLSIATPTPSDDSLVTPRRRSPRSQCPY